MTAPLTGSRLIGTINRPGRPAKPPKPRTVALPADEVAEIVTAYQRGASLRNLAQDYRHDALTIKGALVAAGVTLRTTSEAVATGYARRKDAVVTGRCRACGILLAMAGCGHHDGVCCECWSAAAKQVGEGETLEGTLERWIRATTDEVSEWCKNILERGAA
jgi:hypothetical protein